MGDDGGSKDDRHRADDDDNDDDVDEEDDDEDYVPDADPDHRASDDDGDDDDNDVPASMRGGMPTLTSARRKAVDDAFAELFGYEYRIARSDDAHDDGDIDEDIDRPSSSKRSWRGSHQHGILSSIFGKRICTELEKRSARVAMLGRPKSPSSGGMIRLEKRVVFEIKRFAGQEIRVERVVTVPVMSGDNDGIGKVVGGRHTSSSSSNTSGFMPTNAASVVPPAAAATTTSRIGGVGKRGGGGGVDDLLAEMSRPEKLSAISKTSADWDLFKAKNVDTTLGEQLENKARGNEAYLVKKDFLTRVDGRRFELEKAERDRERTKRGK